MKKVTSLLLTNTALINGNLNSEAFLEVQNELNEPMVIFCDLKTGEHFDHYQIVAKDMEELKLMYKEKVFYTSSIPDGEIERKYGAIFFGVEPNYFMEEDNEEVELVGC